MPPKKTASVLNAGDAAAADSSPNYTVGEENFIQSMLKNLLARPEADWEAMKDELGLKSAKIARDRYYHISKKHGWGQAAKAGEPSTPGGDTESSKTPASRSAKKDKARAAEEDGDPETPVKRSKLISGKSVQLSKKDGEQGNGAGINGPDDSDDDGAGAGEGQAGASDTGEDGEGGEA